MDNVIKKYLFAKHILVSDSPALEKEEALKHLLALGRIFGVKITKNSHLANKSHIDMFENHIGYNIVAPFYKGFPETVKKTPEAVLHFEQLLSYIKTYELGDFENPTHAMFEESFERVAFSEFPAEKEFAIITEQEALDIIKSEVSLFVKSSRPLSVEKYELLLSMVKNNGFVVPECACKDTAMKLIIDTNNVEYAKFFALSDVIKFAQYLNYTRNGITSVKKLKLASKDRRLVCAVIDYCIKNSFCSITDCFEKQADWCGLLHHIHYKPSCYAAKNLVKSMRYKRNASVYSAFEKAMAEKNFALAVETLNKAKGGGAVLRHLNYILSRCETDDELNAVISNIDTDNCIILIQLIISYTNYSTEYLRTFKFARFNKLVTHVETFDEDKKRKSVLSKETIDKVVPLLKAKLASVLKNRLKKVYIDRGMEKVALPLQETTALAGYGGMPCGSRTPMQKGNFIRAFTYWEKVNDIDLSAIGITFDRQQIEFSWRTSYSKNTDAICFSGDQTSGYKGGSEYFDVDLDAFRKEHPDVEFLIFNNNVYSGIPFSECYCKAGYMIRESLLSGEVFEPKTVQTAIECNCDSTYAHLFALDMLTNEIVWLGLGKDSDDIVAGNTDISYLRSMITICEEYNYANFFSMLATKVVSSPDDADVIVSDTITSDKEGVEVIRSSDTAKVIALMNQK